MKTIFKRMALSSLHMKDGMPEEQVWEGDVNIENDGQEVHIPPKYIPALKNMKHNK